MQAWGTIGMYEAREEANPIPQDSSPPNDACNEGVLLATVIHNGPDAGVYFPVYDGNGNVMGYVRGADGLLVAQYEYGPFGELLRASGPLSQTFNPLFSTKYLDWETGLYYYGYRYYSPTSGRWLSRDLIAEWGGNNLYGFVYNSSANRIDRLGLQAAGGYPGMPFFTQLSERPEPPQRRPFLPENLRKCCDEEIRNNGQHELNKRYMAARAKALELGLRPADPGKPGATCKNSSADILRWLAPFPPCWICYLELRSKNVLFWVFDHQVIVCLGYTRSSSTPKEIIFDWWGDIRYGRTLSGGPAIHFRREYPYDPWWTQDPYQFAVTSCDGTPLRPDLPQRCGFQACVEK
ncbi:MAG: hypothetical protein N3J91_00400 [Verrucomicrobiae bacterium]|nr:hypothetical protein [Verrucomicrobiae bacterium]